MSKKINGDEMDSYMAVKPLELKEIIKAFILQRKTLMIKGKPGEGKTSIVEQVANELNYQCLLSHPAISSPTDYKGMPVFIQQDCKAKFLPYETLETLVNTQVPTIYFLDDFGQALPSVQAAIQNLLSSRQVGDHKISDKVVFILATNDRNQGAHVNGVLSTIKSRCGSIVELQSDPKHWLEWAVQNNIRPEVTGFIRLRGEMLSQFEISNELVNFPCPRTVANVSDILNMDTLSDFLQSICIQGAVGLGFAGEFAGWLRMYKTMVSPDYIIANPANAEIPNEPSTKLAIISALAYRANKENLSAIIEYGDRMEPELRVMMIEYSIMSKDAKLKETGAYGKWIVNNQKFLK